MVDEEREKLSGASRVGADPASGHQSMWKGVSVLWRVQCAAREPTTSRLVIVLSRRQHCCEASSRSPGRFSAGGGGGVNRLDNNTSAHHT